MTKPVLKTSKMPGETEQEYTAWLLYCEAGSIPKTIKAWEQVRRDFGESSGVLRDKIKQLEPLPSERSIEKWCSKYRWVLRRDLKLQEDLETLFEKTQRTKRDKLHKLAEIFERTANRKLKQLRDSEVVTMQDLRQIWEIFRTELGETVAKHELSIREEDQKPPTSDEMGEIADISKAFKTFYEQQRRRPGKEAGHLLDNKKPDKE